MEYKKWESRFLADLASINQLTFDFDAHHLNNTMDIKKYQQKIRTLLKNCGLPPSLIEFTARGVHARYSFFAGMPPKEGKRLQRELMFYLNNEMKLEADQQASSLVVLTRLSYSRQCSKLGYNLVQPTDWLNAYYNPIKL